MVSTRTGGVVVIPVGKEQNVQFITTNVKFLTVTTRGTVSVESASVPQDILGSSVRKLTVKTQLVLAMDFVCPDLVSARKAGEAKTVEELTIMLNNVYQIAVEMGNLMLKNKCVTVIKGLLEKTVQKKFVI